jgi:ATP-dependent protease ClpP protease subunit
VPESLSEKRARAGRLGAERRWHRDSKVPSADGKSHLKTARPVAKLRQGRNEWYRIQNKAGDTAEVYIYDEIGYFGVTAQDFVSDLRRVDASNIELHLNTPGGDVFDGIAIYNALKEHDAAVDVVVDSLAASAGSFIAMAGDTVTMTRNATMMIHDAHGLVIGNASDMTEMAGLLDKMSDNIASIYAERAGGSIADWRGAMRAESWYSADEAVEAGLADEVKGSAKPDNTFDLSIYSYAGRDQAPAPIIPEPVDDGIDFDQITRAFEEAFA